ncbi:MAG: aldo/keto reductase [Paludibacteraceae bacterium]|nr:aldo/keto reductase [Paludibacteraceae bacterium]
MKFRFSGKSGLQLPLVSLGLWHNFGSEDPFDVARAMLLHAWDRGVTHFDIANNYGPAPGTAEMTFGRVLREDLAPHRDEMIISSKAGYLMWDGPYGNGGSRKYLISSCDQSLKRTGLEYFDIFYSHRYDPNTPIEETMQALVDIVRSGKALYAGISNYPADKQQECYDYLRAAHVPCVIGQYKASILCPETLQENLPVARDDGSGFICFSPLAQGLLTNRYLNGIPAGSRASKNVFLRPEQVTNDVVAMAQRLGAIAEQRGQTLAQMAIAWLLAKDVTSVIVGASSVTQLEDNIQAINNITFTEEELQAIQCAVSPRL